MENLAFSLRQSVFPPILARKSPKLGDFALSSLVPDLELLLIRWTIQDRYGNSVYLTQERWEHIIEMTNHPEMAEHEEELKETIKTGSRKQDPLNPQKFRYSKEFGDLPADNTYIVAIVLFGARGNDIGEIVSNNFIVTAYQKEIG